MNPIVARCTASPIGPSLANRWRLVEEFILSHVATGAHVLPPTPIEGFAAKVYCHLFSLAPISCPVFRSPYCHCHFHFGPIPTTQCLSQAISAANFAISRSVWLCFDFILVS